jgi:hypothetical protein
MRSIPFALTLLLAAAAPADDAVSLKVVKYPELMRTVRDLQGRVVVVDFWGEF